MAEAQIIWTLNDVVCATKGEATARSAMASGVSIDSRTVQYGDLFIALKGPNFDGHKYVADAFEKGAAMAVVSSYPEGIKKDLPVIIVKDTEQALKDLGNFARQRSKAKFVAVTGSVGKTSVKDMLHHVLSNQGKTHATQGNLNNHYGVPLTLARLPRDAQFAVIEMGMSAPGEIAPLSHMTAPHVAIVTAVAPAHLEAFEDLRGIALEKASCAMGLRPNGVLILNRDTPHFAHMVSFVQSQINCAILGFGEHSQAPIHLRQCATRGDHSTVLATMNGLDIVYRLGLSGYHHVLNSLAVLATIDSLNADVSQAMVDLSTVAATRGRGLRHTLNTSRGPFTLIDDSYNASPASMRAAFQTLSQSPANRRVLVLGDMLELGVNADALHRDLSKDIIALDIDVIFACGGHMRKLYDALPAHMRGGFSDTSDALSGMVTKALQPNDTLLVKGSFGSKMAKVVTALLALDTSIETEGRTHAI